MIAPAYAMDRWYMERSDAGTSERMCFFKPCILFRRTEKSERFAEPLIAAFNRDRDLAKRVARFRDLVADAAYHEDEECRMRAPHVAFEKANHSDSVQRTVSSEQDESTWP